MPKKKFNILLIAGAIAVWGLIIFKIFSYTKDPQSLAFPTQNKIPSSDSISTKDTIVIYANYRDPFVPSYLHVASNSNMLKPEIKSVRKQVNVNWPNIVYSGLIKNTKDARALALRCARTGSA